MVRTPVLTVLALAAAALAADAEAQRRPSLQASDSIEKPATAETSGLTAVMVVASQRQEALASLAIEKASGEDVKSYAESVAKSTRERLAELSGLEGADIEIRPDEADPDSAKARGYLAGGATETEASPGRWNPPGSRDVGEEMTDPAPGGAGLKQPAGRPGLSSGGGAAAAFPIEGGEESAAPAAAVSPDDLQKAREDLAKLLEEVAAAEDFDAAYLKAQGETLVQTVGQLKSMEPARKEKGLHREMLQTSRDDMAAARKLSKKK